MSLPATKLHLAAAAGRLDTAEFELAQATAALPVSDRADKTIMTRRFKLAMREIMTAKPALQPLITRGDLDSL